MLMTKQMTKDRNLTSASVSNTGCVSFEYKCTTDVSFSVLGWSVYKITIGSCKQLFQIWKTSSFMNAC